jgi:hypothetical protein
MRYTESFLTLYGILLSLFFPTAITEKEKTTENTEGFNTLCSLCILCDLCGKKFPAEKCA